MPKASLATMRAKIHGSPWEDLEIPLTWALCLERGLTKTQLCREAGISIGATGAWDRGIRQPSKRIWEKISGGRSYEAMRMREAHRVATAGVVTRPAVPEIPTSSEPESAPPPEPAKWEKIGSDPSLILPVPEPESDAVQATNPAPEDAWDTF